MITDRSPPRSARRSRRGSAGSWRPSAEGPGARRTARGRRRTRGRRCSGRRAARAAVAPAPSDPPPWYSGSTSRLGMNAVSTPSPMAWMNPTTRRPASSSMASTNRLAAGEHPVVDLGRRWRRPAGKETLETSGGRPPRATRRSGSSRPDGAAAPSAAIARIEPGERPLPAERDQRVEQRRRRGPAGHATRMAMNRSPAFQPRASASARSGGSSSSASQVTASRRRAIVARGRQARRASSPRPSASGRAAPDRPRARRRTGSRPGRRPRRGSAAARG